MVGTETEKKTICWLSQKLNPHDTDSTKLFYIDTRCCLITAKHQLKLDAGSLQPRFEIVRFISLTLPRWYKFLILELPRMRPRSKCTGVATVILSAPTMKFWMSTRSPRTVCSGFTPSATVNSPVSASWNRSSHGQRKVHGAILNRNGLVGMTWIVSKPQGATASVFAARYSRSPSTFGSHTNRYFSPWMVMNKLSLSRLTAATAPGGRGR